MTEEQLNIAFAKELERAGLESTKILTTLNSAGVDMGRTALFPICIALCALATAHGASDVEVRSLVSAAWAAVQESKDVLAEKAAETKTKN